MNRFLIVVLFSVGLAQSAEISLSPGSNIQAAVNSNPEGTTFHLMAGMYRLQSVQPKNGDVFVGDSRAAVLSGAALLTNFQKQGNRWSVSAPILPGQTQPGQQDGECDASHPRCRYPED